MRDHNASLRPGAFESNLTVLPPDIDQLGHVNNVVYLRWVQEIAIAHWQAVASAKQQETLLWIVLRHEIDYKQPAMLGDTLIFRTWVGKASTLKFERHTEFLRAGDGKVLVQALTIWCPIDANSRRPVTVGPEVRARFSV